MFSRIFMFISVVIIIQSLPFRYVSISYQKNSSFSIDVEPHTLQVLLLPPFSAHFTKMRNIMSVLVLLLKGLYNRKGRENSRCVIVDAADETSNVTAFVRTNN